MADFSEIIQEINDEITSNASRQITGAKLNAVLRDMIGAVDQKKQDPKESDVFVSISSLTSYQQITDAIRANKVIVVLNIHDAAYYYYVGSALINSKVHYVFYSFEGSAYKSMYINSDNIWSLPAPISLEMSYLKTSTISGNEEDETKYPNTKAVYDFVKDIEQGLVHYLVEPITYAKLAELSLSAGLVPGMQYRITDYTCTTTQLNTKRAGHVFDIIVTADSETELNENARAAHHEGDEYFADCNLDAWELKYCIKNDTSRFAWADTNNGKGVIYYMKDEWNNECPYDFKNIMFRRWAIDSCNACPSLEVDNQNNKNGILYGAKDLSNENVIEGASYGDRGDWFYTFALKDISKGIWHDYSVVAHLGLKASDGTYVYCGDNRIGRKLIGNNKDGCQQWLNNMVFFNCFSSLRQENNDVFSPCYGNTFGDGCESWTLGGSCCETLCDGLCKGITAGETFLANKFGKYCSSCCFGNIVQTNDFGVASMYNIFKGNVTGNIFGPYFISNTAGSVFETNKFGIYCEGNQFGDNTTSNCFGNNCSNNIAGNSFTNNELGNNCNRNSFGFSCNSNSFGNYCEYNECGETVQNNTIKNNCRRISIGRYCINITIFDGVQDCIITAGNDSSLVRFAQILNGVRGSSSSNKLTITFDTNKNYTQIAAMTTAGALKIFNPADLA